jgi:hypothetical protein
VEQAALEMRENYRAEPDGNYRIRFWESWDKLNDALSPTCLVCHRSVHDHAPDCDVWKSVGHDTCG